VLPGVFDSCRQAGVTAEHAGEQLDLAAQAQVDHPGAAVDDPLDPRGEVGNRSLFLAVVIG
jgi:hypothetical protein